MNQAVVNPADSAIRCPPSCGSAGLRAKHDDRLCCRDRRLQSMQSER
jgi:hypothetical protein